MRDPTQIRILTVDDHPLIHEGIAALINSQPDMVVAAEATTGKRALAKFREAQPDLVLMDLGLPDMSGIEAMVSILKENAHARVIILSMSTGDVEIQQALKAGAFAYLSKNMPPQELVEVIRKVHKGKKHIPAEIANRLAEHLGEESLTDREVEVLQLVCDGSRNREIAESLFISEDTVKVHVSRIMDKLGAKDRTQAVAIAVRRGIIRF
jgi:DNA-binding NarL/FixJ family response regulator